MNLSAKQNHDTSLNDASFHATHQALTPLQERIYQFLKTQPNARYQKEALMLELKLTHKSSFTRSLNQLADQKLVNLTLENDISYITLSAPKVCSKSDEPIKPMTPQPQQLELLPLTEFAVKTPVESRPPSPSTPLLESSSMKEVTPEPQTPIKIALNTSTSEQEATSSASNVSPPTKSSPETEKKDATPTPSTPSNIDLDPNWCASLTKTFNGLTKNTKKLFKQLFTLCLKQQSLGLNNYKSLLPAETIKSNTFNARLETLAQKGLIKLSGAKKGLLTLCHSPLHLCHTLEAFRPFLTSDLKTLTKLHHDYLKQSKPSSAIPSTKETSVVLELKTPSTTKANTVSTPTLTKTSNHLSREGFSKRYYLLDSENCQTFLSSTTLINNLNKEDRFILLLSQNSPSTHPEVLHFLLTHHEQIESHYITVRGKGESDLDHALTMELARLSLTEPNAQFVILSKDKGFLAAINYWTQRQQLKPNQLALRHEL